MDIRITIPNSRIRNLIDEAGARYWARDLEWKRGLSFTIIEHGDGPDKRHTVTEAKIRAGLTKMANAKKDEGGHHFADVCDDMSSDMYTGDALIQFAIFGELKYG